MFSTIPEIFMDPENGILIPHYQNPELNERTLQTEQSRQLDRLNRQILPVSSQSSSRTVWVMQDQNFLLYNGPMYYTKHPDLFVQDYCVLDLETTGLSPANCEIIEVGILKIRGGQLVEKMEVLIQPSALPLPERITQITHITTEMVESAPVLDEVAPWIWQFIGNDPIVGYNICFDLSFLTRHCPRNQDVTFIDVLPLARVGFPGRKSYSLSSMSSLLPIRKNTHRALDDCYATYDLFEMLKPIIARKQRWND